MVGWALFFWRKPEQGVCYELSCRKNRAGDRGNAAAAARRDPAGDQPRAAARVSGPCADDGDQRPLDEDQAPSDPEAPCVLFLRRVSGWTSDLQQPLQHGDSGRDQGGFSGKGRRSCLSGGDRGRSAWQRRSRPSSSVLPRQRGDLRSAADRLRPALPLRPVQAEL